MEVNTILSRRGTTFLQISSHRFNNTNDLDRARGCQLSKISQTVLLTVPVTDSHRDFFGENALLGHFCPAGARKRLSSPETENALHAPL
jgi:hypothetical protein